MIPCVFVHLDLEKEKQLNIRLNRNGGQWDWDLLANNFDANDLVEWGFDADEVLKDLLDEEDDEEEPNEVFSEYIGEAHNYVVLKCDNEMDWLAAQTHFELPSVHSRRANGKAWAKGTGRVINGAKYINKVSSK